MPALLDIGPVVGDLLETLIKPGVLVITLVAGKVAINAALDLIAYDITKTVKPGRARTWADKRTADWREHGPLR